MPGEIGQLHREGATTFFRIVAPDADAALACPARVVQSFLELCQNEPQLHQGIRQHWSVITAPLRNPASRWRRLHGFLASVFCTLVDQHWQIEEPELWKAPSGQEWRLSTEPVDNRMFLQEFRKRLANNLWAKAAGHQYGEGLVGGADSSVARVFGAGLSGAGSMHKRSCC